MPIPPPSKDIEAALYGLAAILDRAVAEVQRVIADVKADNGPDDGNPDNEDRKIR